MTKLKWGGGVGWRAWRKVNQTAWKRCSQVRLFHYLAGNTRLTVSACCQNPGQETCILSSHLDFKTAQQLRAQIGKEITSEQTSSPEN